MRPKIFAMSLSGAVAFIPLALAAYTNPNALIIKDSAHGPEDRHDIQHLRVDYENVVIETRTPWTKNGEVITFRGPRILDVLSIHELDTNASVQFIAYDNFTSEITLEEIRSYNPIFAIDRGCTETDRQSERCAQGQAFTPLAPEEQGPIFLVWPYEELPAAYVPARNSIWVWFVVAVRPTK